MVGPKLDVQGPLASRDSIFGRLFVVSDEPHVVLPVLRYLNVAVQVSCLERVIAEGFFEFEFRDAMLGEVCNYLRFAQFFPCCICKEIGSRVMPVGQQ